MATEKCVLNVDLADVWDQPDRKRGEILRTLAWGDNVDVTERTPTHLGVKCTRSVTLPDGSVLTEEVTGYIVPTASSGLAPSDVVIPRSQNKVLRVNFIDVQQGDAAVIETPKGKSILVDGGENQLFARYLAGRFRKTTAAKPKVFDCIVVTHGDADHFSGLPKILDSESNSEPRKRLFAATKRVFHNGLVKRPSTRNGKRVTDKELLGPTTTTADGLFLTGLESDLLAVDDADMNREFVKWKETLAAWSQRAPIEFRRLAYGDTTAFDWINEQDLRIEVLGPITHTVAGKPALRFLGEPPKGPRLSHEVLDTSPVGFSGTSASHTINGHSIVLRVVYGGFSYLLTGDLNDEASRFLARSHNAGDINLVADVFKAPHHGSADFSGAFLQAVAPIVNVVSSGDESVAKEYIHPRATLMGALGRYSRAAEPLVFVTELVAFFQLEGPSKLTDTAKDTKRGTFFGFSRAAWGSVKTRTNGTRLLVFADSANVKMKEAYAYELDDGGVPQPARVVKV